MLVPAGLVRRPIVMLVDKGDREMDQEALGCLEALVKYPLTPACSKPPIV